MSSNGIDTAVIVLRVHDMDYYRLIVRYPTDSVYSSNGSQYKPTVWFSKPI